MSKRPYKPEVEQEFDLAELIERFGSEDSCHAYLEELRWPDGVKCPRCDSDKISRIAKRRQFDCDGCRYQFSVRVGTIFHDSKLPLWKWFLAVYMMGESRKGISANQLKRMLGVSYKTAWYLCHRIRSTMSDESGESLFDRSVIGAYHKLSVKHLPAYLDEAAFRWNNRENPYLFRDTILKLIEGDSLPYNALVHGA